MGTEIIRHCNKHTRARGVYTYCSIIGNLINKIIQLYKVESNQSSGVDKRGNRIQFSDLILVKFINVIVNGRQTIPPKRCHLSRKEVPEKSCTRNSITLM